MLRIMRHIYDAKIEIIIGYLLVKNLACKEEKHHFHPTNI